MSLLKVERLSWEYPIDFSSFTQVCEEHPQGAVLVRFKDRKDAQKCVDAMHGRWYKLSPTNRC